MRNLQAPDSKPVSSNTLPDPAEPSGAPAGDTLSPVGGEDSAAESNGNIGAVPPAGSLHESISAVKPDDQLPADAQDTYFEAREPAELMFCVILAAAYAGLAKLCWEPLTSLHDWNSFFCVEGLFATFAILSLVLGLRPYLSPSSLQLSGHGIKYRGPYWSQRKTVNWEQVFRLYLSPELIIVVYHPQDKPNGVRLLWIQSSYLADKEQIVSSFARYALIKPFYLKNPDWYVKGILLIGYLAFVCWVITMLKP